MTRRINKSKIEKLKLIIDPNHKAKLQENIDRKENLYKLAADGKIVTPIDLKFKKNVIAELFGKQSVLGA